MVKYCVIYLRNGREVRSAWFSNQLRARQALEIISSKHGAAVIYRD